MAVGDVLDLTDCGLNVDAVVTDLLCTGIQAHAAPEDARHPQHVVRRIPIDAIRAAGYRAVRVREWIDWGAGERHADSVYIVDPTATLALEVLPLPDRNFQFPDDQQADLP